MEQIKVPSVFSDKKLNIPKDITYSHSIPPGKVTVQALNQNIWNNLWCFARIYSRFYLMDNYVQQSTDAKLSPECGKLIIAAGAWNLDIQADNGERLLIMSINEFLLVLTLNEMFSILRHCYLEETQIELSEYEY